MSMSVVILDAMIGAAVERSCGKQHHALGVRSTEVVEEAVSGHVLHPPEKSEKKSAMQERVEATLNLR